MGQMEKELAAAYDAYSKGDYSGAMTLLNKVDTAEKQELNATVRYWKGLCRARMQMFDKAIINFNKANELGSKAADIDYELGQAHYASGNLEQAQAHFKKSAKRGFKKSVSS